MIKITILILQAAFLFLTLLCAEATSAQSTALISRDKLFSSLSGYTTKQAALDTVRVQLSREIQEKQADMEKKYKAILLPYAPKETESTEALQARLSAVDAEKFKLLQEEYKMQELRIKSFNKQLEEQYAKDIKPYADSVSEAVEAYAKKNKIDLVLYLEDLGTAISYYNKQKDITGTIAATVNGAVPKK